jgi:hypothetical protein
MNKFVEPRAFADPEAAARKLMEIANSVEPAHDGRIHIELINGPMLHDLKATPAEYKAGLDLCIERGPSKRTRRFGRVSCLNRNLRRARRPVPYSLCSLDDTTGDLQFVGMSAG